MFRFACERAAAKYGGSAMCTEIGAISDPDSRPRESMEHERPRARRAGDATFLYRTDPHVADRSVRGAGSRSWTTSCHQSSDSRARQESEWDIGINNRCSRVAYLPVCGDMDRDVNDYKGRVSRSAQGFRISTAPRRIDFSRRRTTSRGSNR